MSNLESFLAELTAVLDPSEIQTQHLEPYAHDKSSVVGKVPQLLLQPNASDQVGLILTAANTHNIQLVTRASGTSTTGAPLITDAEVLLSLENLNSIIEVDQANRVAITQPGVITQDLKNAVSEKGLYYPPDPASLSTCTIGGNVATNAGGPCCLKYGVTGDYVLGLKGYYGDGSPFELGGKLYKNVAGLDLIRLIVGSEGILAVITEITLRLIPKPSSQCLLMVDFPHYSDVITVLPNLMISGYFPSAAEFIDQTCIDAVQSYADQHAHIDLPPTDFDFVLDTGNDIESSTEKKKNKIFLQFDYEDRSLNGPNDELYSILAQHNALSILEAHDNDGIDQLWMFRRYCSTALRLKWPLKQSHDITVPPASIPTFLDEISKLSRPPSIKIIGYGHIGDGNLHVNILPSSEEEAPQHILNNIADSLVTTALKMGGTISGEHGIGLSKRAFMSRQFSSRDLEVMRLIKTAFDPKSVLNPGKVFT